VRLVLQLLTPVRWNRKYVPLVRRPCVKMSLVHVYLLPKQDVRRCSKPSGSKRSPVLTCATFIRECSSNVLTFSPSILTLPHFLMNLVVYIILLPCTVTMKYQPLFTWSKTPAFFLWIRTFKMSVNGQ
jgi:hypothetical protein